MPFLISERAMQSSVKPLHMLLALWRSRWSVLRKVSSAEALFWSASALLVIEAKVIASDAVASRARNASALTISLHLARAEYRRGRTLGFVGPLIVEASGELLPTWPCLGDGDIVVMVVVAVAGRSPRMLDIAALDVEGIFPLSSSFLILEFRSSSCSRIIDGALVDIVDSVPSAREDLRAACFCPRREWLCKGEELY